MNYHFSTGSKTFPDNHTVKFKELEIGLGNNSRLTIRIYPSNTFVTYHNDYKQISKVLYKEPHLVAQKMMGDWLSKILYKMRMRVGGEEFNSLMSMYWKLVNDTV